MLGRKRQILLGELKRLRDYETKPKKSKLAFDCDEDDENRMSNFSN